MTEGDSVLTFRVGNTLVRGLFAGTNRRCGVMRWVIQIGRDTQKCYILDHILYLTLDIAPWYSEELRLASLGEFNEER